MELSRVFVALVFVIVNELAYCKIACPKNNYHVIEKGGETCLPCNHCNEGLGLSPPCGSTLQHPPSIECFPCVPGKTYSNEHGPSSCKNCNLCSAHEIVYKECTVEQNRNCSHTCEKDYYYENSTHSCQPCSDCCDDGNDIIIKECKGHKMPVHKQCSIHNAQRCKKEILTTAGTVYPVTTTTGFYSSKSSNMGMIVGFSVIGLVIAIVVVLLICRERKNRKQDYNAERNRHIEDGAANQLLDHHYHDCNINKMSFVIKNKLKNQIFEGEGISLLLTCESANESADTQNRNCFKNTSCFEWKKDGCSLSSEFQINSKELNITDVKVSDAGRYFCQIKCDKHTSTCKDSESEVIHIQPGKGRRLKLFKELTLNVEQQISIRLKPQLKDIGNWMDLGHAFRMEQNVLKAMEANPVTNQATDVLDHIKAVDPKLTVVNFCDEMKKLKQNGIVELLKNDLTTDISVIQETKTGAVADRPDSGICDEVEVVDLPPSEDYSTAVTNFPAKYLYSQLKRFENPSYVGSSREASSEDLSQNFESEENKSLETRKKRTQKKVKRKDSLRPSRDDDGDNEEEGQVELKYSRSISVESGGEKGAGRERKRSRSSSIASSIKDAAYTVVTKKPSKDYAELDDHTEESDSYLT